jgi:uncharacterized damage-inducible protein DinB
MTALENLQRLFAYDYWANGEVLRACAAAEPLPAAALGRLAHILSAEGLWLNRLRRQPASLPVWPELTLPQCEAEIGRLHAAWRDYLEEVGRQSAGLEASIPYKNSAGQSWNSRVEDILMHVIMHSAYHRGQIAADLRAAGFTPVNTDFIRGVREGLVE